MKARTLTSILLVIAVVFLAIFAARSIMRPEKFKNVYEARKAANVNNLLTIRSAQAIYKNVYKKYASTMDSLVDFVNNGTVEIEKNVGNFPDSMSEAEAFKLGLIHKEVVKVPALNKMLELDKNLTKESFKNFQYIPFSDKKQYEVQVGSIASKTYEVPVYRIDVPLEDVLVNMDKSITPENAGVLKRLWNKIFYNNLADEKQYRDQYEDMYMGSLTEASTAGSWE
ncbi:MAG: hypothetical protein IKQ75_08000 [Bacteroidales bacterium]|nr:hypothetical protein [Bacteroidales bacterium]MBR6161794.1 hypothetical protein [Bacteroidales bacterium]